MKRKLMRLTSLLATAALFFTLLSGCSKKPDDPQDSGPRDHFRISYRDLTAPEEECTIRAAHLTHDAIYYVVNSSAVPEPDRLYRAPLDGDDPTLLYTTEDRCFIGRFNIDADGTVWFVETNSHIAEDGNGTEDIYLKKVDASGTVTWNTHLEQCAVTNWIPQNTPIDFAVNDAGQVFLVKAGLGGEELYNYDIYWLNEEHPTLDQHVTFHEALPTLCVLPDGRIVVEYVKEDETIVVRPIQTDISSLGEEIALNTGFTRTYISNGRLQLVQDGKALYKWDDAKRNAPLITWGDYMLDGEYDELACADDGTIYGIVLGGGKVEIATMAPCTAAQAAKSVTVAGYFGKKSDLYPLIKAFNKSRPDYLVRVKNYADVAKNATDAFVKLETELLAGDVPDILCLDGHISNRVLVQKGVLQDLYPYLDKDKDVGRDFFVDGLLDSLATDGKLYQVATDFSISTLLADRRVIGNANGLSLARMEKLKNEHATTSLFDTDFAREKLMNHLSYTCFLDFLDWDTGKCQFDNGSFAKLLEIAKPLQTEDEIMQSWSNITEIVTEDEKLLQGDILFASQQLNSVANFQKNKALFGENAVYVGYPTDNGVGHIRRTGGNYGILSDSKNKEGAWAFLRWLLQNSRDTVDPSDPYAGFSANRAAFDAQIAYYQTGEGAGDTPLTGVDVATLKELIKSAKPATNYDREIAAIINDEASYFFASKCSATDAAKKIQSRVSIYVNEQG